MENGEVGGGGKERAWLHECGFERQQLRSIFTVSPRAGMSTEEQHAAVADRLLKRIANGFYSGLDNETGLVKRGKTAPMDLATASNGGRWAVKAKFGSNDAQQ